MDSSSIDVFKCLDHLRDEAAAYAQAKANKEHAEQFRKVIKAELMCEVLDLPVNAQERYAYAHPRYREHLEVIKTATEIEEKRRYLMEAAKLKVQVWQTLSANERIEKKVI